MGHKRSVARAGGRYTRAMARIKAHFDGRFIVPDEPVELIPGQPLLVDVQPIPERNGASAGPEQIAQRLAAARRFFGSFRAPVYPPEAYNRENLYRDDV
jgi:hypothetical protein